MSAQSSIPFGERIVWPKVVMAVSVGKAFVAGAGLGLAALGVVDIAGTLGIRPVYDFIEKEHVLDAFAFGGGFLSIFAKTIWNFVTR